MVRIGIVVVLLALASVALAVLFLERPGQPSGSADGLPVPALADASSAGTSRAAGPLRPGLSAGAPERAPVVAAPGPTSAVTIVGRVVDDRGAPLVGLEPRLDAWLTAPWAEARAVAPNGWEQRSAATDHEGRFALVFDPPPASRFRLALDGEGRVDRRWEWDGLEPGRRIDLGRIALDAAGTILARVVDAAGAPLDRGWIVFVQREPGGAGRKSPDGDGELRLMQRGEALGDGLHRIDGLLPGSWRVTASSDHGARIESPPVEVEAGGVAECRLVHTGGDLARWISVRVRSSPIRAVSPPAAHVRLLGPDGRELAGPDGFFYSFHFPDVADGPHTLVVDDPRFERLERAGLHAGDAVEVEVVGRCALRVEVVDGATAEPFDRWALTLRCEEVDFSPNEVTLVSRDSAPPPDGRFGSLLPIAYTLSVDVPGRPTVTRPVAALAPGEERLVRVEVGATTAVAGRVVDGRGAAVADAEVELYRGAVRGRDDWWGIWAEVWLDRHRLGRTRTDSDGRFRFDLSEGGAVVLRMVGGTGLHTLADLELQAGAERDGLEVVAPGGVHIAGRVLLPGGVEDRALSIVVGPAASAPRMSPLDWDAASDAVRESAPDAEGRFDLGPFGVDSLALAVLDRDRRVVLDRRTLEPAGPGEFRVELDLRATWPGTLHVRVTGDGAPLAGAGVQLGRERSDGSIDWSVRAVSGSTDDQGRHEVELPAGRYRVRLGNRWRDGWTWESPESRRVTPFEATDWSLDVPLFRYPLLLVDAAANAPLADAEIQLWERIADGRWRVSTVSTDAVGRAELARFEGEFRLGAVDAGGQIVEAAAVAGLPLVRWTVEGPEPSTVRVPSRSGPAPR